MARETPTAPDSGAPSHRETCFVCFKPQVTCVCGDITPVHNRVGVSVLQHPRERAHPLGTARFVELGLVNSEVVMAFTGGRDPREPLALPPGTGLLYPRPDALDLEHVTLAEQPRHLLVLDGTWSQARSLYKAHPWLAQLPHYQLSPEAPSRYRIRREPRPEYVSTLESVLLALRILEPDTEGFEGLLSAFDALVDTQIAHHQRARAAGQRKRQKRVRQERRFKGVPRWLAEDGERLVGLYAEALPPACAGPAKSGPLLQLVGMRLTTGETFERLVRPAEGLPGADALATLGLRTADFDDAIAPGQLAAALDGFLRPGDVGLAWNRSTPSLMHDATGRPHRMRLLKPVLRELGPLDEHGSLQSLDVLAEGARAEAADGGADVDVAGRCDAPRTQLRGRAATRLANLAWVAEMTRERGRKQAADEPSEPADDEPLEHVDPVGETAAAPPPSALTLAPMLPGLYLLTGPNGSGKSTRARQLADATPGAQRLSAETQQAFYEQELAQDQSNFFGGADLGRTVHDLLGERGRAHPLYRALRLSALAGRGYRQLSTGESRKVLLLRALAEAPPLIVLDEPFEGLDHAACTELRDALGLIAATTPVVVAGAFVPSHAEAARLLPIALVREVTVLGPGATEVFRGPFGEWLARATQPGQAHCPPPVEDGPWHAEDAGFAPGETLIALRNGRVAYGDQVIFEGLDLTLRAGEHTLVEGPNGSGKSTLLELFTGDHPQAYANDLSLFGRRRGTGETVWDIKRRVGLVSGRLHRDYRVSASVETVLLSGLYDSIGLYEAPGPRARARARQWLAWLDLGLQPDDAFRELSFGVQRLVLVARAAIKVPPLVVLDEPTAGLDPDNRARVLALVRSLGTQTRSTLLFVTHRPDERAWWDATLGGPTVSLRA